jgi:inosine-uridine nucleoside N-ribohydrolase
MRKYTLYPCVLTLLLLLGCNNPKAREQSAPPKKAAPGKVRVIFDTDANNELDDQHALAYLLFNGDTFAVEGITVNATYNGGDIDEQVAEARRVVELCGMAGQVPLLAGANGSFAAIRDHTDSARFDGSQGVDFILDRAGKGTGGPLVLLAVGKLTNVALALKKDPSLAQRVRVVWLGSNYPEPGEYNQDNDTIAMNYVLNSPVPFEMVTVRYGKPSGTDAVRADREQINRRMLGKGPKVSTPVTGRHGDAFTTFGDYSVDLFSHIELHGNPPSRALFDMAAVAIVKKPSWASARQVPAPVLVNNQWVERPGNPRKITVWENFDADKIMADFYRSMDHYQLPDPVQ